MIEQTVAGADDRRRSATHDEAAADVGATGGGADPGADLPAGPRAGAGTEAGIGPGAEDFWRVCTEQLRGELTPQQYAAWIKPLTGGTLDASGRRLRVGAPNRFKLDWVKDQFAGRIEAIAQRYFDETVQLELYLEARADAPALRNGAQDGDMKSQGRATAAGGRSDGDVGRDIAGGGGVSTPDARNGQDRPRHDHDESDGGAYGTGNGGSKAGSSERSRLDPALTFDTFVTGKANQLARAAANQVADNPGKSYNPLFLHGGVGLGKTHLIQAIGNQIIAHNPAARIRYIHADQFVADVVRAYQRKAFDDFKQMYHSLDLLLIDDIQFFSRKEGTQEQFFYAFEALSAAKKQIIITSDTYPAEMQGIEERLISRFGMRPDGRRRAARARDARGHPAEEGRAGRPAAVRRRRVLRREAFALERARARRRVAQAVRVRRLPRQGDHDRDGAARR